MKTSDIRSAFINYFVSCGHAQVASSSLIPHNDPTLLFTNAGMVQFKDVFLGLDARAYVRATSAQRCVRAGGKHNDLDNVGFTARHHTFFEMLGNFSFGDYFKKEAIHFAWEFLTEVLKLPKDKLWITIFESDDEAATIWLTDIGIDPQRLSRCGEKDNFWSMGDVGPCGPCTEIFYDHGPEVAGGPPGSADADGDRYIEIWNLVFMQFNRAQDGSLTALPKPSVDTGMGLERIAAVMQGVHNNYEIDLFATLIKSIRATLKVQGDEHLQSLRVIADHIRSTSFLIADGVLPGNEGRSYVLRRIIRRAIRHGHRLGARQAFFHLLVAALVRVMGDAYPELLHKQAHIEKVLLKEEEQFAVTLDQGLRLFAEGLKNLSGTVIPGELIFKLYDTYGFPADLTADIARERGLVCDEQGFAKEMARQRELSKSASHFSSQVLLDKTLRINSVSEFRGYEVLAEQTKVDVLLNQEGQVVTQLTAGVGMVVLHQTPFYAESGGQVGDQGVLNYAGGIFHVQDTQKRGDAIIHQGYLEGAPLKVGDTVHACVNSEARLATARNHSATHLLHAALRQLLGAHVQQKGSLVDSQRLRFDFLHDAPLSAEECRAIECVVNAEVRANHCIDTAIMTPAAAAQSGAMALFGEKYGESVRVLSMGEFSKELCGGTHAARTGDIGYFKIISESGVAAGVRRLEAVTGAQAVAMVAQQEQQLSELADLLKSPKDKLLTKAMSVIEQAKELEKTCARLQEKLAHTQILEIVSAAKQIEGITYCVAHLQNVPATVLKDMVSELKHKIKSGIVVLASKDAEKVQMVAGVTEDLSARFKANELIQVAAAAVNGRGGGRADMAQASGTEVTKIAEALALVAPWIVQNNKNM